MGRGVRITEGARGLEFFGKKLVERNLVDWRGDPQNSRDLCKGHLGGHDACLSEWRNMTLGCLN